MAMLTMADAARAAVAGIGANRGGARAPARPDTPPDAPYRAPYRAPARVRRDSREAGTFEHDFFAPPARGETDRLLRVARRTLDAARRLRRDARAGARVLTAAEHRITRLTASAVRVLEEILTLARLNRGRVFPSYDHLAQATGLGRATIGRALAVLEAVGFLARQRRFTRIAGSGPGPRYEQTSNVYRALLPAAVLPYLPRWLRPAPLPDDAVQRQADRVAEDRRMRATLSCRELIETQGHKASPLHRALAQLGHAIDRAGRESHSDPQSHTPVYL